MTNPKPESYNNWRKRVHAYIEAGDRYFFQGKTGRRRDYYFECFGMLSIKQLKNAKKYTNKFNERQEDDT